LSTGACQYFQAPIAPTPSNGEMATPVIVEIAWAISTPGVFKAGLPLVVDLGKGGGTASEARTG
jgi:hypothetical protein